ncbi:MAG: radical SAM protein, partial [Planctomycetes bacterium]|nr:radical SAM protein [Planctomycetota bacterium]
AIRMLADAGVPVGVMTAPIIPGLNDSEIPTLLEAARDAGAQSAGYVFLRLPLTVEPVFREWLNRTQPLKVERVEQRLKQSREGKLSVSKWGDRMRGTGEIADQIGQLFRVFTQRLGFDRLPPLDTSQFQRPLPRTGQLRLF